MCRNFFCVICLIFWISNFIWNLRFRQTFLENSLCFRKKASASSPEFFDSVIIEIEYLNRARKKMWCDIIPKCTNSPHTDFNWPLLFIDGLNSGILSIFSPCERTDSWNRGLKIIFLIFASSFEGVGIIEQTFLRGKKCQRKLHIFWF